MVHIISAYVSQVALDKESRRQFWDLVDGLIKEMPLANKIFLGVNFNRHVHKDRSMNKRFYGAQGFGDRNDIGEDALYFALLIDFELINIFYKTQ